MRSIGKKSISPDISHRNQLQRHYNEANFLTKVQSTQAKMIVKSFQVDTSRSKGFHADTSRKILKADQQRKLSRSVFKPTRPAHNRVLSQEAITNRASPWLSNSRSKASKAVNRSSDRIIGNGPMNRSRDNSRKRSALKIGYARSIENLHGSRIRR